MTAPIPEPQSSSEDDSRILEQSQSKQSPEEVKEDFELDRHKLQSDITAFFKGVGASITKPDKNYQPWEAINKFRRNPSDENLVWVEKTIFCMAPEEVKEEHAKRDNPTTTWSAFQWFDKLLLSLRQKDPNTQAYTLKADAPEIF